MVKRFQSGGQATGSLELLIQAFMLDLGIVLGAKSELEALQTGLAAVLKLGKNAAKLFQAWGLAESQQLGAGKQVIALALGGGLKLQSAAPLAAQSIGSMTPTYNAAPTSTAYGDNPNAAISAKQGAKLAHVSYLNGHCPEGYEVEKYLAGGCVKCKQKKALEMKCGGKKRFTSKDCKGAPIKASKKEIGGTLESEWAAQVKRANRIINYLNRFTKVALS